MEVKNAFLVPEPQIHKSREAADAMGTPSAAGTGAGMAAGVSPRSWLSWAPFPRAPGLCCALRDAHRRGSEQALVGTL